MHSKWDFENPKELSLRTEFIGSSEMILEPWRSGVKEKNFGQQAQMMVTWIL